MKTQFIEISRFKVLLTGSVLLLMLNCYQLYADNIRVYYDTQNNSVKTQRIANKPRITPDGCIVLDLTGVQTWEVAKTIFIEAQKRVEQSIDLKFANNGNIFNSDLVFSWNLKGIISEKNPSQEAKAFFELGALLHKQGKLDDAERFYNSVRWAARIAKDSTIEAKAFLNLAILHKQQGYLEDAERDCKRAISLARVAEDHSMEVRCFYNLGLLHKQQGKLNNANESWQNAIIAAEAIKDPSMAARDLVILGNLINKEDNFKGAERCYKSAINAARAAKNPSLEAEILSKLKILHKQYTNKFKESFPPLLNPQTAKELPSFGELIKNIEESKKDQMDLSND